MLRMVITSSAACQPAWARHCLWSSPAASSHQVCWIFFDMKRNESCLSMPRRNILSLQTICQGSTTMIIVLLTTIKQQLEDDCTRLGISFVVGDQYQYSTSTSTSKLTFGPKYPNFGSKKHIFAPCGQLEPHRSMFSTRKRCLIGIPIGGYQNFYSSPQKIGFWAQIWPNLAKNGIFGQILAFLAHLI